MPYTYNTTRYNIQVYYRTSDSAAASATYNNWTLIDTYFDEESEEQTINSTTRPRTKKIQFMIKMLAETSARYIYATSAESFGVVPVKYTYTFTSPIKESYIESTGLDEIEELPLGYAANAETALAQLKTWANAGTVLTLNSKYSVYDSKTVVINPPSTIPIRSDSEGQKEDILVNVSVQEL
jgi:hypothetical protein